MEGWKERRMEGKARQGKQKMKERKKVKDRRKKKEEEKEKKNERKQKTRKQKRAKLINKSEPPRRVLQCCAYIFAATNNNPQSTFHHATKRYVHLMRACKDGKHADAIFWRPRRAPQITVLSACFLHDGTISDRANKRANGALKAAKTPFSIIPRIL